MSNQGQKPPSTSMQKNLSASEVELLIRNNISPLGTRPLADALGESKDDQIKRLINEIKQFLAGLTTAITIDEDQLRTNLRENFYDLFASPEEGIEYLDPSA